MSLIYICKILIISVTNSYSVNLHV